MARTRLAVRFDGAICTPAAHPPLPVPGALDHLVRCLPHYPITIVGGNGWIGPAIDGWLLSELHRHFVAAGVDNPRGRALEVLLELRTADRLCRHDRLVALPNDWPCVRETDALWRDESE